MIEIRSLCKEFQLKNRVVRALDGISFDVKDGEIFGIIGLSGAGKSTLVRCINLLERPTEGNIIIDGTDITSIGNPELLKLRKNIGMIFQGFNLLSQRNVLGNVMFPMEISGIPRKQAKQKALELIETVGLSDRIKNYPSQLSGGQKQRVAIARALATDPKYLLCDECTSALDPTTTQQILDLLKKINREKNVTIVVITHEMRVIEQICDRVAVLDHSHIVEIGDVSEVFLNPKSPMARELILPGNTELVSVLAKKAVRIVFDGHSSFEPVISNMILECRCIVNILYADTKDIGGQARGQMLLQLPDDENARQRIYRFLESHNVSYTKEAV